MSMTWLSVAEELLSDGYEPHPAGTFNLW